ncbi:DUF3800 domain-containing protein [Streptomyces sp. ODS28]|uniref:DUF3800 domain-containing protein n=1 Tax=Streptomyces sp. ODS28 TaxID=3136688 RepID=UPI0031E63339
MHMVFVDDSRQPEPRRQHLGELVAIGGAIFPEDAVAPYSKELDKIRSTLGIPDDEEIKWKPSKGSFLATAGGAKVTELRRRMLELAAEHRVRTAVVIWDRGHLDWKREQVAPAILGYLYERIEIHLDEQGERGVVIADVPGGGSAEHNKWLASSLDLTRAGTQYVKPERVVMPIVTTPSHHVPHVQLADLVVAATTAAIAGQKAALDLVDLLKPLARRNSYGYIGGAGVVLWPPQLNDLYYWVLGEDSYVRSGKEHSLGPTGDPFSAPGRPFQESDGMPG